MLTSDDSDAHAPQSPSESSSDVATSSLTFNSGLKFGSGFALAMIPLLAIFFAGIYFVSRPAGENASLPIERVTDKMLVQMDIALNQVIDRLREIIEATVQAIFDSANWLTATNIDRASTQLQQLSDQTVDKIDIHTTALLQRTTALFEDSVTRFTNASITTWEASTEALITRLVQLLEEQSHQLADALSGSLRSVLGLLAGR